MRRSIYVTSIGVWLVMLVACAPVAEPTSAEPTPLPPGPSPTATPAPTPTLAPTPTPSPTPAPTLAPSAVGSLVATGQARMAAEGIEPLCMRWEDTDADGQAEWIGLHWRDGQPAQLMAFVLDGETWHDLRALETEERGLGEYASCELEIRDMNADGRVEILIWGHAGTSVDLLHVFVWDGAAYALLAFFEGEAGVQVANQDGDLADEVFVGYDAGNGLVWQAVHTWDGASYGWTWERYTWFYLDRPHVYHTDSPQGAVISFYLAVNDRDLPGAYGMLSPEVQATTSVDEWVAGYATTVAVEVGAVHELSRAGDTATVVAQVRAYDNQDGRVWRTLWDVEWAVVRTAGGWRLKAATANELDRWEAVYYP